MRTIVNQNSNISYYSNRTSGFDFTEMDEKYGLENDNYFEGKVNYNNLNCNLLKEVTNMF